MRIPAEQPSRRTGSPREERTVRTTVRSVRVWALRGLFASALVVFLAFAVLPALGLYRSVTVLSGSMRPTFSPGDVVLVAPEPVSAVRVGQVISYQVPTGIRQVETHRIVRILSGGAHPVVQTQGGANNYQDPWTAKLEGRTAWRLIAVVPHVGYVISWLRGSAIKVATILIAPALLALLVLSEIWGFGQLGTKRGATPGQPLASDGVDVS